MAKTPTAKTAKTPEPAPEELTHEAVSPEAAETAEVATDSVDSGFVDESGDVDPLDTASDEPDPEVAQEVEMTDDEAAEAADLARRLDPENYQYLPNYKMNNATHIRIHRQEGESEGDGYAAVCREKEVWVRLDEDLNEIGLLDV
jgi:hypothetical protein